VTTGRTAGSPPSFAELVRVSLRVGLLGFGGPAGQTALMHRLFVQERRWIDEDSFLHALSYCMLLPGPEAQQLATYVGWRLHGVRGGLVAGWLFVLPGALIVLALSWLYAAYGRVPLLAAALEGLKAAVLALVFDALVRVGRRTLRSRSDALIAGASAVALYAFGVPFPLVILAACAWGLASGRSAAAASSDATPDSGKPARVRGPLRVAATWTALWLTPLAASLAIVGPSHLLSQVGLFFSRMSIVTFGGAYAVLAYVRQQAVEAREWLTASQMIDGLGLAETTPGPLILVNQFVGFMAGWQAEGGGLLLALGAAAMASWCTFAPSFVWIFAGAPYAERLRRNPWATRALAAISAAVLGVIASLALWFALHVLFDRQRSWLAPWGETLLLPDVATLRPTSLLLALAAGLALVRHHAGVPLVVLACAATAALVDSVLGA
jgi:chromate transporter